MSLGDRVAVMRSGVLQQVEHPARGLRACRENVFVAAFIGTPRINLLQAVVLRAAGRPDVDRPRQAAAAAARTAQPRPPVAPHPAGPADHRRPALGGRPDRPAEPGPPRRGRADRDRRARGVPGPRGAGALQHRLAARRGPRPGVAPAAGAPARRRRQPRRPERAGPAARSAPAAHVSGPVVALDDPEPGRRPLAAERPAVAASDLVVRTGPDCGCAPARRCRSSSTSRTCTSSTTTAAGSAPLPTGPPRAWTPDARRSRVRSQVPLASEKLTPLVWGADDDAQRSGGVR